MDILKKIAAQGKVLFDFIAKEYAKIASPAVRLAILFILAVAAFILVWKALPFLLVFGLLIAAAIVVKATMSAKD